MSESDRFVERQIHGHGAMVRNRFQKAIVEVHQRAGEAFTKNQSSLNFCKVHLTPNQLSHKSGNESGALPLIRVRQCDGPAVPFVVRSGLSSQLVSSTLRHSSVDLSKKRWRPAGMS